MKGKGGKKITLNKLFFEIQAMKKIFRYFRFSNTFFRRQNSMKIKLHVVLAFFYIKFDFQPSSTQGKRVFEKNGQIIGKKMEVNQVWYRLNSSKALAPRGLGKS